MSQDLFAAFGDTSDSAKIQQSSQTNAQSFSFFDDFGAPAPVQQQTGATRFEQPLNFQPYDNSQPSVFANATEEPADDDFGDFEDAENPVETKSADVWGDDLFSSQPATNSNFQPPPLQRAITEWPTSVQQPEPLPQESKQPVAKQQEPRRSVAPRDPDILFDAEDEELEDDFGDFEEPEDEAEPVQVEEPDLLGFGDLNDGPVVGGNVQPKQTSSSLLDLEALNFADEAPTVTQPRQASHSQAPSIINAQTENPQEESFWDFQASSLMDAPEVTRTDLPETKPPAKTQEAEQPWDDFNAWEESTEPLSNFTTSVAHTQPPTITRAEEPWDDFNAWEKETPSESVDNPTSPKTAQPILVLPTTITSKEPAADELPPSNVPPPAVLLSLFPEIFASAENAFFKPTSSQAQAVRTQIYADPATTIFLQGFVAIGIVCARVIAGRKQRWKRDVHLSQSMRIGSASAGKLSGMKVASVDKAETAKEDREVADVLRAWQTQVGRLKSAVAEAKKAGAGDVGSIPELRDVMPVRVAKEIDGGVPGFKPCALCGLKRDERVGKVDFEVQDSFGEWWIDGTNMHRGKLVHFSVRNYLNLLSITTRCPQSIGTHNHPMPIITRNPLLL
jgi:hypothetical protein